MRVRVSTSGGFANIRISGEVDTDDLEAAAARRVLEALRPELLETAVCGGPGAAVDTVQYEVILYGEGGGVGRTFLVEETAAPGEVLEALRLLTREIVRRRRKG